MKTRLNAARRKQAILAGNGIGVNFIHGYYE